MAIPAQALRYYEEPGGKLASAIGNERSQPPEIVRAKLFEHVRVVVHHAVVVAANGACSVENQAGVAVNELRPVGFTSRWVTGLQQAMQRFCPIVTHMGYQYGVISQ